MKKTTALKALVLSMVMVLGFVMPMAAQTDGFFKNNNEDIYGNRDGGTSVTGSGITNQQFGQTVPVGSGLLIMVAAGAGYAVARRRRSMRKAGTMLLALAMVLTFTQCKKRIETINQTTEGKGVHITLRVEDNSKVGVNENGVVTFENGDIIFVINGNNVVGALAYNGTAFEGEIGLDITNDDYEDDPTDPDYNIITIDLVNNDKLHFCFTGNVFPEDDDNGDKLIFIGGQKDKMPVLSCGSTEKTYAELVAAGELNKLKCELQNKCALVKFTITNTTDENNNELEVGADNDVTISNVCTYAKLIIDTDENENNYVDFIPSNKIGGIELNHLANSDGNERWAIILPQETATVGNLWIDNLKYENVVSVSAIENNDLKDITINCNGVSPTAYNFFSVRQGKRVVIAPGNLQYKKSEGYRFAPNAYDVIGVANENISDNYDGWIDLFGWGTGNNALKSDSDDTHYTSFNDWGDYVTIDGGGWYTPNAIECLCLFGYRGNPELEGLAIYGYEVPLRFNKTSLATVCGVEGVVILPDYFRIPSGCSFNPPTSVYVVDWETSGIHWCDYTQNTYDTTTWPLMQNAGAVFIPASGKRYWDNNAWHYTDASLGKVSWWTSEESDEHENCGKLVSPDPVAIFISHMQCSFGLAVRLFKEFSF